MRALLVLLVPLILLSPEAAAAHVDVASSTACAPTLPAGRCWLAQPGELSLGCGTQCTLLVVGDVDALDNGVLMQLRMTLSIAGIGSSSGGCTLVGTGQGHCGAMLALPVSVPAGACTDVVVSSSLERPLDAPTVSRAFVICADATGAYSLSPA